MNREQFNNLQPGQEVVDREFNVYGSVMKGEWSNCLNHNLFGNGIYIKWDDGDGSEVGLEHHNDEEIDKFELVTNPGEGT